jgi:hypothetical protein
MPRTRLSLAALAFLIIAPASPRAQEAPGAGPCGQITAACQGAGFIAGGAGRGTGLIADCVLPIMQGTPQPRQARRALPRIDPRLIADCKASNPRFGGTTAQPRPSAPPSPQPVATPVEPQVPAANGARRCAATADAMPSGLAVVLASHEQRERGRDLQALNNPSISGVALQINWRDIEPVQGRPDWSKLDDLFAAAEASHKWVQLLIFPGFFSPAWALQGAETDLFAIQYGPGHGTVTPLPMPWDQVYLGRWFAFLKQIGGRFGGSPAFRMIAADGPTSVSAEMTLPHKRPEIAKWLSHGYTPARYLAAWQKAFQVYAQDFPDQCISLSAPGLPLLEGGRVIDAAAHARARQTIIDQAGGVFGKRFALQWSDLHAGHAAVEAPDQTSTVIGLSGRLITGLQMRTSAEGDSDVMGAPGQAPLALRRSIDKGMAPNQAGQRINYLEIYEPDVLAPEMQSVLQYAAAMFARK